MGTRPPGVAAPEADFEKVETTEAPEPARPRRFNVRLFNEITPNLDQKWLIDDVLPLGGFGLLYAKPNAGKSFVALNMALAISRGTPWHGRDTEQGSSLYISAEGTLADRVAAYRRYYELEGQAPPFALIEDRVNLRDTKADTAPLI